MKKTYKTITTYIVLLCMVSVQMAAQLSGTVTIDQANATGGTNYQTFNAFASALNSQGVSGPLVVNVVTGTGPYVEQVQFNQATGVSATNTITINGNGNTITFNSSNSSAPYIIGMNSADRMNFNNLNVIGTGSYAYCAMLWSGADYNSFSACTFSVPMSTSSGQIPVVLSGSGTSYGSFGNSGSYNTFEGCTMTNGYFGVSLYGNFSVPYPTGNKVLNCTISDWYQMGIQQYYYHINEEFIGNTIEQPTRTSVGSCYGIYAYYSQGTKIERNRIQKLYNAAPTSGSTCYGIYLYYNTAGGGKTAPHYIRNNIISDIKHNGQIFGMMIQYADGYIHHNTISLDNTSSTSGSSTYGIYSYAQAGYENDYKDNIVSITRGGSGSKYGLYYVTGSHTSNYNDVYVASLGGTNYFGYYSGTNHSTLASFTAATNMDVNSKNLDPVFTNIATGNLLPTSTSLNNQGIPVGVFQDINLNPRSSATPDMGALEFLSPTCAGTPSANTVLTPTYQICPGSDANIQLGTYFSDLGITYQWRSSTTSSVGPFTNITGATGPSYLAPNMTANTWFSPVITCTNGGGSTSPVGYVQIAGTTTNSVPYLENFEGVPGAHKLPNCSWSATNLGTNSLVYMNAMNNNRLPYSGNKFASFYYTPATTSYFYSNGIQLNAGVVYSTSVMYTTEYYGYTNWQLSIMLGTSQSSTGLVMLADAPVAVSPSYKMLSDTFQVATSGIYYVAVRGISTSGSYAQYLSWDDLRIDIPCDLNAPTVNVTASQNTICAGQSVVLTATGADDYLWDNGTQGSVNTVAPLFNTTYQVVGTHTASGCSTTFGQNIIVNPAPNVNVISNPPSVCAGSPVTLIAFGAVTYSWSSGGNGNNTTVVPSTNTSYTVLGSNSYGCIGSAVQTVSVNALPVISATAPSSICLGESAQLTGNGGVSYKWMSSSSFIGSNPAFVSPNTTTTYTLEGTDANGCVSTAIVNLGVDECVGLNEASLLSGMKIYPNPTTLAFTVELNNGSAKTIEVLDLTGRVILTGTSTEVKTNVNISSLANGIYYVKVKSENSEKMVKIIKE